MTNKQRAVEFIERKYASHKRLAVLGVPVSELPREAVERLAGGLYAEIVSISVKYWHASRPKPVRFSKLALLAAAAAGGLITGGLIWLTT